MNVQTLKTNHPDVYKEVYEAGMSDALSASNPLTLRAELAVKTITSVAKDLKAEKIGVFEEEVNRILGLGKFKN